MQPCREYPVTWRCGLIARSKTPMLLRQEPTTRRTTPWPRCSSFLNLNFPSCCHVRHHAGTGYRHHTQHDNDGHKEQNPKSYEDPFNCWIIDCHFEHSFPVFISL